MPDILVINEGPVRKIRINRPDKKNALTLAMYETMAATIEDAGTNAGVRCLLITGTADVFCAGNDLNDFVAMANEWRPRRADRALPSRPGALRKAAGGRG